MLKRVGFQDCHHDRNNVYPLAHPLAPRQLAMTGDGANGNEHARDARTPPRIVDWKGSPTKRTDPHAPDRVPEARRPAGSRRGTLRPRRLRSLRRIPPQPATRACTGATRRPTRCKPDTLLHSSRRPRAAAPHHHKVRLCRESNEDPRCAPMVRDLLPCGDAEYLPAAEPGTFSPERPERPARAAGLGDSEMLR